MSDCIQCDHPVRPRQECLLCDGCQRLQHRTCGTGITRAEYRIAVATGQPVEWQCQGCHYADNERISYDVSVLENDDNGRPADASLFVADLDNYVPPAQLDESDMVDPGPLPVLVAPDIEGPMTYTVGEASTERGKDRKTALGSSIH